MAALHEPARAVVTAALQAFEAARPRVPAEPGALTLVDGAGGDGGLAIVSSAHLAVVDEE